MATLGRVTSPWLEAGSPTVLETLLLPARVFPPQPLTNATPQSQQYPPLLPISHGNVQEPGWCWGEGPDQTFWFPGAGVGGEKTRKKGYLDSPL